MDKGLLGVYTTVMEYLVKYGFQVLGGLLILLAGFVIAHWVGRLFTEACKKRHMDVVLTGFLAMGVRTVIIIFTALMAVDKFGITISPLIASVSALVFGASFAIQAPLSNYAAGLMIILTRPFTVGNTISVQDVSGVVLEVKLPNTVLVTEDGEKITIPNKDIVGQILLNSADYKVVERTLGISYGDDPEKAIRLVLQTLERFEKVAKKPRPQAGIENFGDSAIHLGIRYWAPTMEYYETMYAVNLAVFKALKTSGITIPFPQREVRLLNQPLV